MSIYRIATMLLLFITLLQFFIIELGLFPYIYHINNSVIDIFDDAFDDHHHSPQQVHISLVGADKMRISWITPKQSSSTVTYGTSPGSNHFSSTGTSSTYHYLLYVSDHIHHVLIGPLAPNTRYFYRLGSSDSSPELSFKTAPNNFPIIFAVAGDLGQTEWTQSTLQHIQDSDYDVLLLPGDLSYADTLQPLWDSFGILVEPLASERPWMVTHGNHEVEKTIFHSTEFTSFNSRWRMPYEESGSRSNLYYSFEAAGVHVIMLGSYTEFGKGSKQYKWLEGDLRVLDRKKTPWVVVVVHAPWYNTNTAHRDEKESVDMKAAMEGLLYEAHVDIVFAGHVHAYERFERVYNGEANVCGPAHITIGDGGNREGLARMFTEEANLSAFREASFGHGRLNVVNETHAHWSWHRNDNAEAVEADSVWYTTLASNPTCR